MMLVRHLIALKGVGALNLWLPIPVVKFSHEVNPPIRRLGATGRGAT